MIGLFLRVSITVATAFCLTACVRAITLDPQPRHERRTITRAEIDRSGAHDAWEAIRRAGTYLSLREGKSGGPVRATERGRSSFLLSDQLLVVVDGVMVLDVAYLKDIPAVTVYSITILSSAEGTSAYGTFGGNGVIIVITGVPAT